MSNDLKRQILRQTVEANLALREGTTPAPANRPARRRRATWPWIVLAALPVLAVAALPLVHRDAPATPAILASAEADSPDVAAPAVERWVDAEPHFPTPVPMDPGILPLAVRHIVLDPGHGGHDVGTVRGDIAEKELTLDIADRLRELLVEEGFQVSMTRRDDRYLSLRERAEMANEQVGDVFVSIHINWIVERAARGIETYFLGPTDDPELAELARRENRESGYSLADQRTLLEGIFLDMRHARSRDLAGRVQQALYGSLLSVNPKLQNRGVKTAPFVVLVATEMPAVLAEVSCLSNADEADLLKRPLYRQHIAEALARGLRGYAKDVQQTEENESS